MKRLVWIAIAVVTLLLIVGGAMASQFNLSALPEPDKMNAPTARFQIRLMPLANSRAFSAQAAG
jgi:flagellar basal body-associated protein FliL